MMGLSGFQVLALLLCKTLVTMAFTPPAFSTYQARRRTNCLMAVKPAPPAPTFSPAPLPVMLAGGLFLFATSVKRQDRTFANDLLAEAQRVLQADPLVTMELGQGIETGGVYASSRATTPDGIEQLVVQFQIEGGNAWAQGIAYGVKQRNSASTDVQLVAMDVANMDGSMNGTPIHVSISEGEESEVPL